MVLSHGVTAGARHLRLLPFATAWQHVFVHSGLRRAKRHGNGQHKGCSKSLEHGYSSLVMPANLTDGAND